MALVLAAGVAPAGLGQTAAQATAESAMAGAWSGALDVEGMQLRLALHVTVDGGVARATLDSLDQEATGIPASRVARTGDRVTFEFAVIAAGYAGVLSPDGLRITGEWSQGGLNFPLEFRRAP